MRKRTLASIALISAAAIALSGCTTSEEGSLEITEDVSVDNSDTSNENNNDEGNQEAPDTDGELVEPDSGAEDGFGLVQSVTVIKATCQKALSEGITEGYSDIEGNETGSAVLLPDEFAIDGYSAAYADAEGNTQLIFETGQLASCGLNNAIELAEEASEEEAGGEVMQPAEIVDIISFEEGTFLASLGDGPASQKLFLDIDYDVDTNIMTSITRVTPEGEPIIGPTVLEFGYSEDMRELVAQALENFN